MNQTSKLKSAMAGIVAVGVLALGATAQAVPYNPNLDFGPGYGDAANPVVITVNQTGGFFQETINFDLGSSFTHFNMTSTTTNLSLWFGASIFENVTDAQVAGGAAQTSFASFPLGSLGLTMPVGDYHLHPAGVGGPGGSYTLTMWGSNAAPVPVPAAVYLFGSGLIGLVGLARRKMSV